MKHITPVRRLWSVLAALLLVTVLGGCWAIPRLDLSQLEQGWPQQRNAPAEPAQPRVDRPVQLATVTPRPKAATVPAGSELALPDLYRQVNQSVVNIAVVVKVGANTSGSPTIPGWPQFGDQGDSELYTQGQGSGFVYDAAGHIVTNNHVVADAREVTVTFADDTVATAQVVGTDPDSDLAVIKVDVPSELLAPLTMGSSDDLEVGQEVVAIGNPFGLSGTMTTGIVSALGRLLPTSTSTSSGGTYTIPDIIQTDAAINPGNSGGPLFNRQGEVVGVTTAIESPVEGSSGVGYAVPASIVERVVPALIAHGEYQHPWLGVTTINVTPAYSQALDLPEGQRGVMVVMVTEGSPAAEAGLNGSSETVESDGMQVPVGGDIIVGINDQPVTKFDDLISYLSRQTTVGDTVVLTLLRDGKTTQVDATLQARPR